MFWTQTMLSSIKITLLILLRPASSQLLLDERGCIPNEADPHPNNISCTTLNATGSFTFPAFRNPNSNSPQTTWTWSTGIKTYPIWLNIHGVDLASADM